MSASPSSAPARASITFHIAGLPAPAGSKRGFVNRKTGRVIIADDSKRTKPWQAAVASAAAEHMDGELLAGPLGLHLKFHLPRPAGHYGTGRNADSLKPSAPIRPTVKPDLTKLVRAVEDALTGIVWRDDAQVVQTLALKIYGPSAGCFVTVHPIATDGGAP